MKKIITIAALSAILLAGCSLNKNADVIIKVNGTDITRGTFEKIVDKEIDASPFKNFGGTDNFIKDDSNIMYLIFKEKVTKELIVKTLLDSEINKRGIKVTDEDIKSEMKSIIDKVGSKEELNKILKQRGVSNSEFTEDLKSQIKIKKLVNSVEKIKVSDADAERYYKANPAQFKRDEQVRASHILVSYDTLQLIKDIKAKNKNITPTELNAELDKIKAEQKAKAEAILAQIKANPDKFEEIARKKSDDKSSGERGGELGFFSRTDMVPEFSKAAFAMKPNTISETIVLSPYGYHIIKVTDRIEAGTIPYVKVKDEIKFYLETEKQIKILKNLTDGLMKTANIEYVDKSFDPQNMKSQATKTVKKEEKK